MNILIKSVISSVAIGMSVVGFVDILAENETTDVFDNGNTKPMLSSYIDNMRTHSKIAIAEAKYEFDLNDCEQVIKRTLPFQEVYKGCENNIVQARMYLTSL